MSGNEQIVLGGHSTWAYVVDLDGGLRVQLSVDEWDRMRLYRGQRVAVRRAGRSEERLCLAEVVELPPIVWIVLYTRVPAWA